MLSSETLRKKLRELVKDATNKRMTQAVKFYAEKLVALSKRPEDIYTLALAYHDNKEYRRAVTVLRSERLTNHNIKFTYLTAKCLYECNELQECSNLIGADSVDEEPLNLSEQSDWRAAIFMLRGRTWEALENLENAVLWYKRALTADPYCYEAFDILIHRNLLPHAEEKNLIDTLSCLPDGGWIKVLYSCFTSKYAEHFSLREEQVETIVRPVESEGTRSSPLRTSSLVNQQADSSLAESVSNGGGGVGQSSQNNSESLPNEEEEDVKPGDGLISCLDIQLAKAEWYYHKGCYSESYVITKKLLETAPEAWDVYPVHLSCCLELKKQTELYQRGQELSRINPESAITWFAIGVYYMCIKRFYEARKSFGRSHGIDKNFSHAWIGYGNAFAGQAETEQAMAAYRTANRLFPGLHLPSLYLGMENLRLNNNELAEINFQTAYRLCPTDPLVSNELGVLEYNKGKFDHAVAWFQRAIDKMPRGEGMTSWEAIFVNLGHALRKQGRYDDAIRQYQRALVYRPDQGSTFTAIGFTYHLQDKFRLAIENYQSALIHDRNDQFAHDLLQKAAENEVTIRRRPPKGSASQRCGPLVFEIQQEDAAKPRNILEEIIWYKNEEVEEMRTARPVTGLLKLIPKLPPTRDFKQALLDTYIKRGQPGVIAEVKKASPSKGVIQSNFDPVKIAKAYEKGGASCLSVLTDRKYFQGGFENLKMIKDSGVGCPLLCKEFVIDGYQLFMARASGADAVLLIAAVLPNKDLNYFIKSAKSLNLQCLIEVHNEIELRRATELDGIDEHLIGINNRDLETFNVDLDTTARLLQTPTGQEVIKRGIPVVGESGIYTTADIEILHEAGCKAVLVGESIVKGNDQKQALIDLIGQQN
eukprot:g4577.t1